MGFYLALIVFIGLAIIAVMGVFVLTGMAGLFSFGQAAFMAVGAYVSALLAMRLGWAFFPAVLGGVAAAVAVGLVLGLPVMRLRRDYFALATFGFGEAVLALLIQAVGVTGGAMGLFGIPIATSPWLVVLVAAWSVGLARLLKFSSLGRDWEALKTDEVAAEAMGVPTYRRKIQAFLISCGLAGLAGALFGFYLGYVDPAMFGWFWSAELIIILFFGGINSITGTVISAVTLTALPELLRFVAQWRVPLYCAIVIATVNLRPQGVFGDWELSLAWLRRRARGGIRSRAHPAA
jgi:branched-chain amino acid transport system permease protein